MLSYQKAQKKACDRKRLYIFSVCKFQLKLIKITLFISSITLAKFQVLCSHTWVVAATLDGSDPGAPRATEKNARWSLF